MAPVITSTRSIWLAAFLLANGLRFHRATSLAGEHFRVNFFFEDPDNRVRALTRQFLEDVSTQRLISGRNALLEVLSVARQRGVCETQDVTAALTLAATPWAER